MFTLSCEFFKSLQALSDYDNNYYKNYYCVCNYYPPTITTNNQHQYKINLTILILSPSVQMIQSDGDFVQNGDTVIVKMHDEVDMMVIVSFQEHKIGKTKVSCGPLIGAPYGSIFEIRGRKLIKDPGCDMITSEGKLMLEHVQSVILFSDYAKIQESNGDNRSFTDTNTAQKLSNDDIHKLKSDGASGSDIISSLIANSETWSSKSEFSQEKWLKRKQKKYET